jgi:hypothetical protein
VGKTCALRRVIFDASSKRRGRSIQELHQLVYGELDLLVLPFGCLPRPFLARSTLHVSARSGSI